MSDFRVVVAGLGIQGQKRRAIAGADVVATVDPVRVSDYRSLNDVPRDSYDAVLLCVPDTPKLDLVAGQLAAGKHVLVEKPLFAPDLHDFDRLESLSEAGGAVCYTAYNHRFEPHIAALRDHLAAGDLGRIYRARFFYGNGTARDVRGSPWRDQGAGVLPDLGSHLMDMILFLFGSLPDRFTVWSARAFENRAFDHVICGADGPMLIECEMSLLSWRNQFVADIYGEAGSAHIDSLCKWGPSSLTLRRRQLPSGRPTEETRTLIEPDPTWALEYAHFKRLCAADAGGNPAPNLTRNLVHDRLIHQHLTALAEAAMRGVS